MKKLPKVFKNDIKNIHNNKKVFDSTKDNNIEISNKKEDIKSVKDKVKDLLKDNNYIFNKEVILVYKDKDLLCNIAGIVNNHIITMDNEIIKISDLIDIKY